MPRELRERGHAESPSACARLGVETKTSIIAPATETPASRPSAAGIDQRLPYTIARASSRSTDRLAPIATVHRVAGSRNPTTRAHAIPGHKATNQTETAVLAGLTTSRVARTT